MRSSPLAGLSVLVTRPAHQAAGLVLQLEEAGAAVSTLPLLRIGPPRDAAVAAATLQAQADADLWIFTSANAVDGAAALYTGIWPERLLALGQGTVRALARHGRHGVAPEGGTSEELLRWPVLAALQGKRVLIVTGDGGRRMLSETLVQRGAAVAVACCYQREPVRYESGRIRAALAATNVAAITSGEALQVLLAATAPAQIHAALLLPSQRVALVARDAGYGGQILLPAAVSDAAILKRLEQWHCAPHNDCP